LVYEVFHPLKALSFLLSYYFPSFTPFWVYLLYFPTAFPPKLNAIPSDFLWLPVLGNRNEPTHCISFAHLDICKASNVSNVVSVVNVVLRQHQPLLMASTICIFGNQIMFAIACSWRHHCRHYNAPKGVVGGAVKSGKVGKSGWWWWWCQRWQANYTCQSQVTECAGSSGSGYLAICHAAMAMECRWLRHKCPRCIFPIGGTVKNYWNIVKGYLNKVAIMKNIKLIIIKIFLQGLLLQKM